MSNNFNDEFLDSPEGYCNHEIRCHSQEEHERITEIMENMGWATPAPLSVPTKETDVAAGSVVTRERIQYRCMACPERFTDAASSNAHHDSTGHNQTFRCYVCDRPYSAHTDREYNLCHSAPVREASEPRDEYAASIDRLQFLLGEVADEANCTVDDARQQLESHHAQMIAAIKSLRSQLRDSRADTFALLSESWKVYQALGTTSLNHEQTGILEGFATTLVKVRAALSEYRPSTTQESKQ